MPYQLARINSEGTYAGCLCLVSERDMVIIDPHWFGDYFEGKENFPHYSVIHENAIKNTLVAYGENHFGFASLDYHIRTAQRCLNALARDFSPDEAERQTTEAA